VGVLPPAHAQRLHLVRTAPRTYVARPSACKLPVASLVLDKDVDAVALRKALEANNLSGQVGMAELEGQVRTVLTAITRDEVASAMAKLPSARGKVVCGRVAIDRWVE
jgi:hypothetical protein